MSQESLDFGRGERVNSTARKLRRVLGDIVDQMGLIQAAGACDARKSELNDALSGREGRYLRLEWLLALMDAATGEQRRQIVDSLTQWVGLVAVPLKIKTPEERLAELEQRVASRFGQAGLELVEEVRR